MSKPLIDADANPREQLSDLLKRHSVDCLVCPKAGACEIQDLCARWRPKIKTLPAELENFDLGMLIERHPERCIRCGRCAEFVKSLGEEATALPVSKPVMSPLSGTLIDICPAAALIDKTQKKLVRAWETEAVQSIDTTDCALAPVKIETYRGEIVRIVPADGGLISDKARFSFDGLRVNRLDRPYRRVDGVLKECSWDEALKAVAERLNGGVKAAALIGKYADCESMLALRDLFAAFESHAIDARAGTEYFDAGSRQFHLFNTPFSRIKEADALLTIGVDLSAVLPASDFLIRQNPMPKKEIKDLSALESETLFDAAEKPMLIVGAGVSERADAAAAFDLIYRFCKQKNVIRADWNGYNFASDNTAFAGAGELGLMCETPLRPDIRENKFDFVYVLNDDSVSKAELGGAFVVYQGFYASRAARAADVIFPGVAPTEKHATYVDAQGVAKSTAPVLPPFGQAREDWKILRALSEYTVKMPLPYDDLAAVRDYLAGVGLPFYKRGELCAAEDVPFGKKGEVLPDLVDIPAFKPDEIFKNSARMRALRRERQG
ncbi:MAG TPA: hypothetical protein DD624_04150 [Alphaproteobacteria bacterium]|nr:hypothetical protein [Alphaproteobacteria bacterium]